ncbi:MAG: oligosaccharide flippase family protein [Candidatus Omnitrophica bacterium]|nr:oligosaccharide flippase family protein [Candidatus Omnitrophota bacterium]MDD5237710.1 oligosaccharide flippase family protein [Candidatus Omnitrophota bacterium]
MEEKSLSTRIIWNIIWNFLGQTWVLAISFFATPFIVRSLNVNIYGIYTLVGVIIGYFSFLKFGLGTASVKYISQYLASEEEGKARSAFWSCLGAYIFLGALGMILIAFSAPVLVEKLLKIPPELRIISIVCIRLGSVGFFIFMLLGAMSGPIQAAGRFDILNRIGIMLYTLQIAVTVTILKMGFSLREIISSHIVINLLAIYIYWVNIKRILPFFTKPSWDKASLIRLFKFGGFVTISSIVDPILTNIEKILLTSLRTLSTLTYYTVPFSLIDRLSVIRSSFSSVLMPTFSSFQDTEKERISKELHYASTLFILFLFAFFVCFFLAFGRVFLQLWMGNDFAQKSTSILVILSFAGLINALAAPSFVALQGMNKPQLPAVFHLIETIIYIPLSVFLIYRFGGNGAACAWLIRVLLDTALLHKASCDLFRVKIFNWYRRLVLRCFLPLALCSLSFWWLKSLNFSFLSLRNISAIFLTLFIYAYFVWRWGLDSVMRDKVKESLTILYKFK